MLVYEELPMDEFKGSLTTQTPVHTTVVGDGGGVIDFLLKLLRLFRSK